MTKNEKAVMGAAIKSAWVRVWRSYDIVANDAGLEAKKTQWEAEAALAELCDIYEQMLGFSMEKEGIRDLLHELKKDARKWYIDGFTE